VWVWAMCVFFYQCVGVSEYHGVAHRSVTVGPCGWPRLCVCEYMSEGVHAWVCVSAPTSVWPCMSVCLDT
jgi:hypothetical protein